MKLTRMEWLLALLLAIAWFVFMVLFAINLSRFVSG